MVDLATIGAMCELDYSGHTSSYTPEKKIKYRHIHVASFDDLTNLNNTKLIQRLRPNSPVNEHTAEFKRTNQEHRRYTRFEFDEPEITKTSSWKCLIQ